MLERVAAKILFHKCALEQMDIQNPEPVPLPALQPAAPAPREKLEFKPEIIVAPPALQVAPKTETEIIVVPERAPEQSAVAARTPVIEISEPAATLETAAEAPEARPIEQQAEAKEAASSPDPAIQTVAADQAAARTAEQASDLAATTGLQETAAAQAGAEAATEVSEREKLRQAEQIQVVSFFVSGQLFLLPVAGIQEVLRHMELVKVPQAPDFIAGAINLRGAVMPLIHLSALLTNSSSWTYDERSFIIVTGGQGMQMGLIIDKVSSMHLISQQKIIWNVESKLGDAGEFLSALVDLDDRVCGMIAPDIIKQKLFAEF